MIFNIFFKPLSSNLRPALCLALSLFGLSGCIFSEVESEEFEIIFQSDGTVQYTADAIGVAATDFMEMSAAEISDFSEYFNDEFSAGMYDLFDGQVTTATGDFSDLSRVAVRVDGVFPRAPTSDLGQMGNGFMAHPILVSPDVWAIALIYSRTADWPVTVCISLSPEWSVQEQGRAFPALATGERTCANWTELRVDPSDLIFVEYNP